MSGPRNREKFEKGQQRTEQIRALMLEHAQRFPLARQLTAAQIQDHVPELALSTIYWHMDRVRKSWNVSNSSAKPLSVACVDNRATLERSQTGE